MKSWKMLLAGLLLTGLSPQAALAAGWNDSKVAYDGELNITVHRSATCGCCKGWIEHLRETGFTVEDVVTDNVNPIKQQHGLPPSMASCHTALIDGYVIEGHVPADDIKRLLTERPAIAGLAVPGMPTGGPGMEYGDRKDPFAVIAFDRQGNFDSFREYWEY